MKDKKVIGIGLQKTGTSSVHAALEMLGYKSHHCIPELYAEEFGDVCPHQNEILKLRIDEIDRQLYKYDALNDLPVALPEVYEIIMQKLPNALYIYTDRDPKKWTNSVMAHISQKYYKEQFNMRCKNYNNYDPEIDILPTRNHIGLIEYTYQKPISKIDEDFLIKYYAKHKKKVFETAEFNGISLNVMNLPKGDGWTKLCDILGRKRPSLPIPFPQGKARQFRLYHRSVEYLLRKLPLLVRI